MTLVQCEVMYFGRYSSILSCAEERQERFEASRPSAEIRVKIGHRGNR
jgi:hypothetical protein